MEMLDIIKSRRSIRKFREEPVPREHVDRILEAGRWAPSGLNNQPWRFAVITGREVISAMAEFTRYSNIVNAAGALIAVFLDNEVSYHRLKDAQAVGACLQNMLLEAHSMGLGAVWLGEIIKSNEQVKHLLGLGEELELMAVIALGYPVGVAGKGSRKKLRDLIVFEG